MPNFSSLAIGGVGLNPAIANAVIEEMKLPPDQSAATQDFTGALGGARDTATQNQALINQRYGDLSQLLNQSQQQAGDYLTDYAGQAAGQLNPYAEFGLGAGQQLSDALSQGYQEFDPNIGPTEELAGYQDMLAGRDQAIGDAATRFAGIGKMFSGSAADEFANIGGQARMGLRENALNRAYQNYQTNQGARNQWMGQLGQMLSGGQQAAGGLAGIYGNLGSALSGNAMQGGMNMANLGNQNLAQLLGASQYGQSREDLLTGRAQNREDMIRLQAQERRDQANQQNQGMLGDILGGIATIGGAALGGPIGGAIGSGLSGLFGGGN